MKSKRLAALFLALVIISCCFSAAAEQKTVIHLCDSGKYEGDGFATPDEAALCYLAGIKNLDFDQVLSAFAWETQADHFDFISMITRAKGIDPTYVPGMPICNNLTRTANIEQIRDKLIDSICTALYNYVNDEILQTATYAMSFKDENAITEYLQRCDNGRLEKLTEMKNIRFYTPDVITDGRFSTEQNQKNFTKQTAQYGADEVQNVFVAVDIGDETYGIAPTVARYGGRWYIVHLSSMTSNIIGIDTFRFAFFRLSDDLKSLLSQASPITEVTDLPIHKSKIQYEGGGFSTPENAVKCYFEGLKNGSIQQMLQAFAWETLASRYSLKEYALWMSSISYSSPVRIQMNHPFMTDLNMGSLRYKQFVKIYNAIRRYILEDEEVAADLLNGKRLEIFTRILHDFCVITPQMI